MDDIENNLSDQERKYVEVYEQVSGEVQQKRNPEQIVRELMEKGYTESDARRWVTGVTLDLRRRMLWRSAWLMIPGLVLIALGVFVFGTAVFGLALPGLGIILVLWGLAMFAEYA